MLLRSFHIGTEMRGGVPRPTRIVSVWCARELHKIASQLQRSPNISLIVSRRWRPTATVGKLVAALTARASVPLPLERRGHAHFQGNDQPRRNLPAAAWRSRRGAERKCPGERKQQNSRQAIAWTARGFGDSRGRCSNRSAARRHRLRQTVIRSLNLDLHSWGQWFDNFFALN